MISFFRLVNNIFQKKDGFSKDMDVVYDRSVMRFIDSLEKPARTKTLRALDLLVQFGYALTLPVSRKILNNLFELQIRGTQEVRLFYAFSSGKALVVHGFIKKTNKTPRKEIVCAQKRFRFLTGI